MFWLRHKTFAGTTWTQRQFEGLSFYVKPEVTRLNGETLRSNLFSHVKAQRATYAIVISADETATAVTFLADLWAADMIQVSELTSPDPNDDGDGVLVITEGGQLPVEFIDGHPDLREYSFSFRAVGGA